MAEQDNVPGPGQFPGEEQREQDSTTAQADAGSTSSTKAGKGKSDS